MNVSAIDVVVSDRNVRNAFNRIHAEPLSSKYNLQAQKVFSQCFKGHCYSFVGKTLGLALSLVTTSIALIETIASLAYATLATLVHTLTFLRSKNLQDHVVKSWAFCRHSFLMIWSPFLLLAQSKKSSVYEIELRQHFYKINCAQAAQSIGSAFDTLACRNDNYRLVNSTQIRNVEISIEGLTSLINDIKTEMPLLGEHGFEIDPKKLPLFNQFQFMNFLRDFEDVKNDLDYKTCFNRIGLTDAKSKRFVKSVATGLMIYFNRLKKGQEQEKAEEKLDPFINQQELDGLEENEEFDKEKNEDALNHHQALRLRQEQEALNRLKRYKDKPFYKLQPDEPVIKLDPVPKQINLPDEELDLDDEDHDVEEMIPQQVIGQKKENPIAPLVKDEDQNIDEDDDAMLEEIEMPAIDPVNALKVKTSHEIYDEYFARYVKTAIKEILRDPKLINIINVENPLEGLSKEENLRIIIEGNEEPYPILRFALYKEMCEMLDLDIKLNVPQDLLIAKEGKKRSAVYTELFLNWGAMDHTEEKLDTLVRLLLDDKTIDKNFHADIKNKDLLDIFKLIAELGQAMEYSKIVNQAFPDTIAEIRAAEAQEAFNKIIDNTLTKKMLSLCLIKMLDPKFNIDKVKNIPEDKKEEIKKVFVLIKKLPKPKKCIQLFYQA